MSYKKTFQSKANRLLADIFEQGLGPGLKRLGGPMWVGAGVGPWGRCPQMNKFEQFGGGVPCDL